MNKQEFIERLQKKLSSFPKKEVEERVSFYAEMIDDRMEEGLSEEEAVAKMGSVESVALEIAGEMPLMKSFKEKMKPNRKFKTWEIVLLALGSPIWISLLASAVAVVVSLYVSLWSVVISAWAVFFSVAVSGLGGAAAGVAFLCLGKWSTGAAFFAAAFVCIGLTILFFYVGKSLTKSAVRMLKKWGLRMKKRLIKKEELQ